VVGSVGSFLYFAGLTFWKTFGLSFDCRDWLFLPGLGYGVVPGIVIEALWNACRVDGGCQLFMRTFTLFCWMVLSIYCNFYVIASNKGAFNIFLLSYN